MHLMHLNYWQITIMCVRVYTLSCVSAFVCINGHVRIRYAFCVSVYNVHVHSMMIESALYN